MSKKIFWILIGVIVLSWWWVVFMLSSKSNTPSTPTSQLTSHTPGLWIPAYDTWNCASLEGEFNYAGPNQYRDRFYSSWLEYVFAYNSNKSSTLAKIKQQYNNAPTPEDKCFIQKVASAFLTNIASIMKINSSLYIRTGSDPTIISVPTNTLYAVTYKTWTNVEQFIARNDLNERITSFANMATSPEGYYTDRPSFVIPLPSAIKVPNGLFENPTADFSSQTNDWADTVVDSGTITQTILKLLQATNISSAVTNNKGIILSTMVNGSQIYVRYTFTQPSPLVTTPPNTAIPQAKNQSFPKNSEDPSNSEIPWSHIMFGKPVIYVYDTWSKTNSISVSTSWAFVLIIPKFTQWVSWTYNGNPDGSVDVAWNHYPYLRYEADIKNYQYNTYWRFVTGANIESFFKDKLTKIGLNTQEQKGFLEYWIPTFQKNKEYFISFKFNSDLEKYVQLIFDRAPATLLRVMMESTEIDSPEQVSQYTLADDSILPHHIRSWNNDVVEWGGTIRLNKSK